MTTTKNNIMVSVSKLVKKLDEFLKSNNVNEKDENSISDNVYDEINKTLDEIGKLIKNYNEE